MSSSSGTPRTGGSGVSSSPRPAAYAVRPVKKNGTSEPSASATCGSLMPSAASVAAASLDPPPNPPPAGMRLRSAMATFCPRAARTTRFVSSVGTAGSSQVSVRRSEAVKISVSCREMVWKTVSMSW